MTVSVAGLRESANTSLCDNKGATLAVVTSEERQTDDMTVVVARAS